MTNGISRRQMIIGTGVGAAGALLARPTLARPGRVRASSDVLSFGLISDVHQDIMHDGEERLRAFVDDMNATKPDFVLQLGDFCTPNPRNNGFMSIFNEFAGPRHHVIGNHEMDGGFTREQVVEYFGMPGRYYSFDSGGVHFVVLDGNDPGGTSSGYKRFVAEDQMKWLRDDLASTSAPTVVFIHQPLDSSHGVDNRTDVRRILETANATDGHADVVAVFAGHSHLDYCRAINGIAYVMINSAAYQWLGAAYRHQSYSAEIHAKATALDRTCPYRDPLWATVTIDLATRSIEIEGRSTEWVGPSPNELGATPDKGWSFDPTFSRPHISSWRLPMASDGDLA